MTGYMCELCGEVHHVNIAVFALGLQTRQAIRIVAGIQHDVDVVHFLKGRKDILFKNIQVEAPDRDSQGLRILGDSHGPKQSQYQNRKQKQNKRLASHGFISDSK